MDPVFHFEIPAGDMKRAKKFYESVFGWIISGSYQTYYRAAATVSGEKRKSRAVIIL